MSSASKIFLKGSFISLLGVGIIGILNYFIRRKLALELSVSDYGFFYAAFAPVMMLLSLIDLGLSKSGTILIAKELAKENNIKANTIFNQTFYIKLISGIALFLLIAALSPILLSLYFKYEISSWYLVAVAFLLPLTALETVTNSILNAELKFTTKSILLIVKISAMFIICYLLVSEYQLSGAITVFVSGAAIACLLNFLVIRLTTIFRVHLPKKQIFEGLKEVLHYSKWIAISTFCMSSMYYMDSIMLTLLTDLESVALYNIALPMAQIVQSILVLPAVFTPIAVKLLHKKNYDEMRKITHRYTMVSIVLALVVAILGFYFGKFAITLLFSEKFTAASSALTLLCTAVVMLALVQFYLNILDAAGKVKLSVKIMSIGFFINIVLNIILIPIYNIEGAAASTLISYMVVTYLSKRKVKKLYNAQ